MSICYFFNSNNDINTKNTYTFRVVLKVTPHNFKLTTHQTSLRFHRNFRRCPAGLEEPCSGQRRRKSSGRNTSRSFLRRFPPPTRPALRVQRAEPRYTPSRFSAVKLRCLLLAPGALRVLHVLKQLSESDAPRAARGFYSAELHQLSRRAMGGGANRFNRELSSLTQQTR